MTGTRSARPVAMTAAGLALLVWMNYYLRHTLEGADAYLFSFYKYFYPVQEKIVFSSATPWWKLLLPIPQFTGVWNTTTLVLARVLEPYLRPATEWYLFNAILIVASFWTSWVAFRSRVFSFTLAICMGFGTQLYVTYPNSGTISFPLLFVYYETLLLAIFKLIVAETNRALWRALFAAALLCAVLAYEPWLDLLVVTWVASAFLYSTGSPDLPHPRRWLSCSRRWRLDRQPAVEVGLHTPEPEHGDVSGDRAHLQDRPAHRPLPGRGLRAIRPEPRRGRCTRRPADRRSAAPSLAHAPFQGPDALFRRHHESP